jgi:hypothetical protein
MTIQKAFISDAAFTIDDHGYAAVVTADYTDKDTGAFEIVCDILGYCEAVSLSLDNGDILAVRELLGIGSEIERPFTYNELLTPKGRNDLDMAVKALEAIAALEDPQWTDNFKFRQALAYAQQALAKINEEAEHAN